MTKMMAASGTNVVYARPIRLVKDSDRAQQSYPKRSSEEPKRSKHVTIATPKSSRTMDMENSSPPPRPPPPRPARVPKHPSPDNPPRHPGGSSSGSPHQNQTTPEPKPLTRTNVTSHDKLWKDINEEESGVPADVLSPPLKHITPESAEEMWKNFDPLDVIDSHSEHSDSSADTMIMMTTEEERANQEKIDSSIREAQSRKSKPDIPIPNTNKLKVNIQSKKNLHIQFADTNGFVRMPVQLTNGVGHPTPGHPTPLVSGNGMRSRENGVGHRTMGQPTPSVSEHGLHNGEGENVDKVGPLHVRTTTDSAGSSPESDTGKRRGHGQYISPNDSPDDGYGTNSSTGTVSSPFSSSFNSSSDLENSCNGNGTMKKVILPNGAIKPNSVRESWAVKRKQRMIEGSDNSVQEQLRELAIIEEEGSGSVTQDRTMVGHPHGQYYRGNRAAAYANRNSELESVEELNQQPGNLPVPPRRPMRKDFQSNPHVVNVSQTDLSKQTGDLYVISGESETPAPPRQRHSDGPRAKPQYASTSEINTATTNRVPPTYNDVMGNRRSRSGGRSEEERSRSRGRSGEDGGSRGSSRRGERQGEDRSGGSRQGEGVNGERQTDTRTIDRQPKTRHSERQAELRHSERQAELRNGERQPERSREARLSSPDYESGEFSSYPDSVNSAPLLRGGDRNYPTQMGSGKIYVSPNGDEGFYSLNRSSRSTSVSSFDPLLEQGVDSSVEAPSSPKSPLEILSGDLLEKWSDMDRNYRNYYGFETENEKYSRTDSKINYFQEKKINRLYGQDNYYRPATYGEEPHPGQGHVSGQGQSSSSGNQGTQRDLRTAGDTEPVSHRTSSMRNPKTSKEGEKSKSKLFQILPNMFKPSSKKQNAEQNKKRPKTGILKASPASPVTGHVDPPVVPPELEQDSEYMNIGDMPRYSSLAHILHEEKLAHGEFVPLESLQKRPVFASSKDIQKLFSKQNQSFDSLQHPGSQRHSFHAMPLSYRHVIASTSEEEDMRPRAQSTSATMRSQFKTSVENRMAVIAQKNAAVMNQARPGATAGSGAGSVAGSVGNLSVHSNSSTRLRTASSRARLNSSTSSGEDPKLSTLV